MQNVKVRPTPRRTCRGELHWFCSFYWRVITKGHPGSDIPTLSSFHSYSSTRTSNIATITDLPRILIFLSILAPHDSRPNNLSLTTAAAGEIVFHFQAKSNEVLLIVSNHHHFTIIKYYYPLSSSPTNNTHLVLVATVGAAVGGGGGGLAQEFTFSQTWLFSSASLSNVSKHALSRLRTFARAKKCVTDGWTRSLQRPLRCLDWQLGWGGNSLGQ